jgi:hypothetical protein
MAVLAGESNASPSGLDIEYDTEGKAYFYRVVEDGEAVGIFPCSYQPEEGNEEWSAEQARAASWHWHGDGKFLAVEEANHRHIGTVILARRFRGVFQPILLVTSDLMTRSGENWERGRLFFGEWLPDDRVRIVLSGRTGQPPGPYEYSQYECVIDLRSVAKIESCKKIDSTPDDSESGRSGD